MADNREDAITTLLSQLNAGDQDALGRLTELIYPELRALARRHFRHERSGHLLQPTALVSEAYVRLVGQREHNWQSRGHFFAAASQLMRRILVDCARAQLAKKRDGGRAIVPLEEARDATSGGTVDLLALDEALDTLEKLSPRQARIVQLRYFGGLTVPEIAETLSLTSRTVDRDWAAARAWLRLRLRS